MNEPLKLIDGARVTKFDPAGPPEFSDEGLALRFAEIHADNLRYVAALGKWLHYDGTRWVFDSTLLVFSHIRRICRDAAANCDGKDREKSMIASASTVAAVERLARADRRLAATAEQWDRDPLILNTPAGVIDLTTGIIRKHDPADHLTKITACAAGGNCPLWRDVLNRLTDGDLDLQEYLARVIGYSLTGLTREHALWFFFGHGGNGKSLLLNTVSAIVGDYAKTAPIETFTASTFDRHPTDLAALRGARLVTAIETEEGRSWNESRIKTLTGGDKIAARFMRQDFFEFTPMFKLVIAGNHKPSLRSVDEAMKRRFNLVHFAITIPADERDPDLPEKLKAEWPGILQWAIDGCREWLRDGLRPPNAVTAATADYLEDEDALLSWIAEGCQRHPDHRQRSSDLFKAWKVWAEQAGEHPGTQKRFKHNLEIHGFASGHTKVGTCIFGLTLNPQMTGHGQ